MKRMFVTLGLFIACTALADETNIVPNVLTVSAEGKVKVRARIADVRMTVQVDGRSAIEVQQELARHVSPVIEALRGLKADDIEAAEITITPQHGKENPQLIIGYRGQSTITFSALAEQAGGLIDAAIGAGANQLQSVSLRVDDQEIAEARGQALKDASRIAQKEAKLVLDALGLEQKAIYQVTVNGPGAGPVYPTLYRASPGMAAMQSFNTEVLEQEQDVRASLTLLILYAPMQSGGMRR